MFQKTITASKIMPVVLLSLILLVFGIVVVPIMTSSTDYLENSIRSTHMRVIGAEVSTDVRALTLIFITVANLNKSCILFSNCSIQFL